MFNQQNGTGFWSQSVLWRSFKNVFVMQTFLNVVPQKITDAEVIYTMSSICCLYFTALREVGHL